jgi:cytochrome c5
MVWERKMKAHMMRVETAVTLALGVCFVLSGHADAKKQQGTAESQPAAKTGEQVFMTNCSRCHLPPMSLSPRITGTVIMHMRVRARLSREDEKLLLNYLAP